MIDKSKVFEKNLDKIDFSGTTSVKFKEDLYEYFGENFLDKKILELGTHHGYSTRFFSFFFKEVHTIDKSDEYIGISGKFCSDRDNINFWHGDLYNQLEYFQPEPRDQGITVPGVFDELPKDIEVVFIDASHLYHHVLVDALNSIMNFDKPILIFDDYGSENPVKMAVDNLVKLGFLEIEKYVGHETGHKVKNRGDIGDYLTGSEGVICKVLR
tara:strand:- start:2628 stop:3266 length:639 start_codon:yes stop_codon:yes gene_type:complete